MRTRSFTVAIVLILLSSLLASSVPFARQGDASPLDASGSIRARAQGTESASPPAIEPDDGDTASQATPPIDAGELSLEIGDDLGDGGQPEGLPREVEVGDARYLFDRIVPGQGENLIPVAQNETLIAYAATSDGPFASVYLTVADGNENELYRYLPEQVDAPEDQCPAEAADTGQLNAGDLVYVFAGFETDLSPDELEEVGTSDDLTVYAAPGASGDLPEVFVDAPEGLMRYVLTGGDGLPVSIAGSLAFDGAQFTFVADVTGQIDPSTLTRLGCSGPFPVLAGEADDDTVVDRYVLAGDRLFQFNGEAAPIEEPTEVPADVPTEQPTEAPTEQPTEEPTEVPTEVPTEEPTDAPTEAPTEEPTEAPTESPIEAPTEAPTEEPTEIPTEAPTEIPTEAPTEQPEDEPTAVPTEAPTEQSTEEPAEPPAEAPTEVPTEIPTEVPTESPVATSVPTEPANPTPAPTVQLQPPAVVPTLKPNAPPPAAVTAEPVTACAGDPGTIDARGVPARLPNSFQFNGIAYAFAGTEDPDQAGELTRIGCLGPFAIAHTDAADRSEVLYLQTGGQGGSEVFRFEAAITYGVEFEITGRPQVIAAGEQEYRLVGAWQRSIYSSTTVILFAENPEDRSPDTLYAVNVFSSTVGDVIGEYHLSEQNQNASDEMVSAADGTGLNPDLVLEGQRYLLVNVFVSAGTTTNGFVTLFAASGDGDPELLIGRDLRRLELFIYNAIPRSGG
jgi:hypothetical protein